MMKIIRHLKSFPMIKWTAILPIELIHTALRILLFEVDNVAETLEKVLAKGGGIIGELVHADYEDGRKATFCVCYGY